MPMIRIRRFATILHSTVLVAALAVPAPARAQAQAQVGSVWSVVTVSAVEEPASVLGLESEDGAAGEALTKALRKAFAKRGLAGGQEMSLSELRLTMGCSGDDPKCLAEGGKAIEVRRLVYGSLKKTGGGGYTLQLNMLDVTGAVVEKELARPLSASDLSRDKIDATATAIVSAMLPEETDETPVPDSGFVEQPVTDPQDPGTRPQPKPKRDKKYVWGLDKPVPRWKKIGVGVSAGLFVLSLGTAIGLTIATQRTLRDKLVRKANESLLDVYPEGSGDLTGMPYTLNDVNPTEASDICATAREHPPEDTMNPKSVRNKKVTEVCNVADGVEKGQFAAWAATAVFGVSTIAFTVLLFVKKNENAAAAAAWRHDLRLGATPSRSGMTMGASFRF
jgi:hypothetical protein